MRYGKFLAPGGTIGVTAPSYGASTEPYTTRTVKAKEFFEKEGFRVQMGETVFKGDGIGISTDPAVCGKELTDFYCGKDNDIIISAGGGELMCETIDHVDWERMKAADPKWYLGYSDNTNMTFLLPTLCDTAALYGYCFGTFGRTPMDASAKDFYRFLTGGALFSHSFEKYQPTDLPEQEDPVAPFSFTEPSMISCYQWDGIPIEGRFLGGCLDLLTMYPGTCYDRVRAFNERYKEDGVVWFLEACDFNVYGIRRALWILKHAGWFETAKGFLFGRPLCMGQTTFDGLNQYNAVLDVLEDLNVPILMDLDIGHIPPQMPIISGAYGRVFRDHGQVQIMFELK